jgi:hypothetical protein
MRGVRSASACLLTVALAACGGGQRQDGAGTAGSGTETGATAETGATGGTGMSDTAGSGMGDTGMRSADTGSTSGTGTSGGAARSDSAQGNQTESGVTNTETGKGTLGEGVSKTRPDQGEAATSKGDTLNRSVDSTQQ